VNGCVTLTGPKGFASAASSTAATNPPASKPPSRSAGRSPRPTSKARPRQATHRPITPSANIKPPCMFAHSPVRTTATQNHRTRRRARYNNHSSRGTSTSVVRFGLMST